MGAMTVGRLHKYVGRLIEQGHKRKPICVSKTTFQDPCESDGATILGVYGAELVPVLVGDDDGGSKTNKDGSESYRMTVVLNGGSEEGSGAGL